MASKLLPLLLLASLAIRTARAEPPTEGPPVVVAPAPAAALLPMGVWLRSGNQLYFSYVDAEAGPSMAGIVEAEGERARMIVRVTGLAAGFQVLDDTERVAAGLPVEPDWLKWYGKQPPRGSLWGTWRADPLLLGRFHPEYPDDLQVIVYAGTPEKPKGDPEVVWVRLQSCADGVCEGRLLNEPFHIKKLHAGDPIRFRTDAKPGEFLVMLP